MHVSHPCLKKKEELLSFRCTFFLSLNNLGGFSGKKKKTQTTQFIAENILPDSHQELNKLESFQRVRKLNFLSSH